VGETKVSRPETAPPLGRDFKHDDGPQRNVTGPGPRAFCYIHKVNHRWADCPSNPAFKAPKEDL
jgi:hypothetical protein